MTRPSRTAPAVLGVFVVASTIGVALSASIASGPPILGSRWALLGRLALWATAWLVAVAAALRLPRRLALGLILTAAIALRLAALAGPPTTSDDLFRYSWDGRVQAAGIDAYAHTPQDPRLVRLREPWLWPDPAGCAAIGRRVGCTRINRSTVRTIYPPVAEAWFAVVYRVAGIGARAKAWQVAGLVTELATLSLLVAGLRRWGRDPRWVALYALSPAPVLELVNNGHVDGLAIALLVAALVVIRPPPDTARPRLSPAGRDVAAGLLIGAAALVKLYPAVLLVVLIGLPRARPWLAVARASLAAAALSALAYAPHVAAAGTRVLGYLPGYLREEHYDSGGRFLLAGALGLSGGSATAIAGGAVVAALVWVVVRRPGPDRGAFVILTTLFLATTPVQPWYAISLLAVATLAARPWPAAVVAAGYPYFFGVILALPHTVALGRASYGLALAVGACVALVSRRWSRRRGSSYPERTLARLSDRQQ